MGNFFKIKEIKIYSRKVKKDIQITVLSDLHISNLTTPQKLKKLEEKINSFSKDYICIVGDILDHTNILENKEKVKLLETFLQNIAKVPILVSIGNHDMGKRVTKKENKKKWIPNFPYDFIENIKQKIPNLYILDNQNYQDKNIYISGYTPPYNSYYENKKCKFHFHKDLQKQNFIIKKEKQKPSICLIHNPIYLTRKENSEILKQYDILLAGHMHNGIVPPILDELWKSKFGMLSPNKKPLPKNARGIIKINNKMLLIISSGIVKIAETAPKIMWKLDTLFPMGIENITISAKEIDYNVNYHYEK